MFTDVFAISNLTGGGYWFQAEKDGCIDQQFVSVSAGRWIGVDIVPLDTNENGFTISSVGANDGKIEARITNGFNDFTFRWENGEDASLLRANLGAGAYSIELTSQEGCLFSDSIRLYDPFGLDFPEAFSPNGDGLNDYFEIRGLHLVPENSLVVYNEEGIEAFSASPYANEWGGIMCEVNWPDGQYSYVFVAAGKTYRGVVLILRDEQ